VNTNTSGVFFPTGKQIFGYPKTTVVKYAWIVNTVLLFPFFVSSIATSGGGFPGGLVFSDLWIVLHGSALSVYGFSIILDGVRPHFRTELHYGALLASLFYMSSWMLTIAINHGNMNNIWTALEAESTVSTQHMVNLAAIRSVIAFSVFLFLGYGSTLCMLFMWRKELAWCNPTANTNKSLPLPGANNAKQRPAGELRGPDQPNYEDVDL